MKAFAAAALFLALAACQTTSQAPVAKPAEQWRVDCRTDQVTNLRRCFAGTFAETGTGLFQVYYLGSRGPFILAGFHTFPGRKPLVRFDNDAKPFTVADDAGVTANSPQPAIVERMKSAQTAYVQYASWPDGARQMTVDVSGFDDAWKRLQSAISQ